MNKNKAKARQFKVDTMNPILKNGYFLYIQYKDIEPHYEIHYFESAKDLSDYLIGRYSSTPGRRLYNYYINDLIEGKTVRAKLDHEGTVKLHRFQVFHGDKAASDLVNTLRIFFISTTFKELNQIGSVEEMKERIRTYNEIVMNPPRII